MEYQKVKYGENSYYVCKYSSKDKLFIIDASDLKNIKKVSGKWEDYKNRISIRIAVNKEITRYFLDKIIMEKNLEEYDDEYVIHHINGNFRDSRKENMQIVDLKRRAELANRSIIKNVPEDSDIFPEDIPKCIRYDTKKDKF